MFTIARIKLTAWYLLIIMGVSLSFSGVMFIGVNRELGRIENFQRTRIQGLIRGYSLSIDAPIGPDFDAIKEARLRFLTSLGLINLSILIVSGLGGYFLAGQTLEPIAEMVREQKNFVSNASHELRTPLTSLKTQIEVALRDKKLKIADARDLLKSNLEDVDGMQKLANYLLAMNKYEANRNLSLSKVDLKDVALKAVDNKNIKTELTTTIVSANFDSLVELTNILIDNAIKYGQKKEITVSTRKGKLSVKDNGIGIAPQDLPHIFDRFYRSDKSRGTEGYGLGLAIAKNIAEANHATLSVKSKPGLGSTFTVTF